MSQISNEPIGSKENPFICNNEQELLSLPLKTYCKYFVCKCTICGQTSQPKQEIKKYLDFCKEHHFNVRSFKV
jgi:hypothetical protein